MKPVNGDKVALINGFHCNSFLPKNESPVSDFQKILFDIFWVGTSLIAENSSSSKTVFLGFFKTKDQVSVWEIPY